MSDCGKEVESTPAPVGSATAEEFLVPTNGRLALRVKTAPIWMWVCAGLSVLNLALADVGAPIRMVFSL